MWFTAILVGITGFLVYLLYRSRVSQHAIFRTLGIPGPEPHWWYGNLHELRQEDHQEHNQIQEWTKQYGKVYGYYEGPTAIMVSSDPDMLQEVFIKKFSEFHGRKPLPLQPHPDNYKDVNMFNTNGHRWKRLRTIINPTFSSAKLKQITPLMNRKVGTFLEKLEIEAAKGPFNIQSYLQCLAMDVIGEAAFGVHFDAQNDPKQPLLEACRKVFEGFDRKSWLIRFAATIPEMRHILFRLMMSLTWIKHIPRVTIVESMGKVIEARRDQPRQAKPDLMQLMIDAEATDIKLDAMTTTEETDNLESKPGKQDTDNSDTATALNDKEESSNNLYMSWKKKLTNNEIKNQGLLFLLAGYETTSTVLSYASYLLALNPHIQDKLFEEIDPNVSHNDINFETLHTLQYLDMVLYETLRMYPHVSLIIARRCMEACTVQGLDIPKDMVIQADVWSVHHDADLWGPTDPQIFEPERFTPERKASRHPMAWIPFGAGPRNCVGLRFGLMEAKIALAKIIKHFRIERCEKTQVPLQLAEKTVISPRDGVFVKLTPRK